MDRVLRASKKDILSSLAGKGKVGSTPPASRNTNINTVYSQPPFLEIEVWRKSLSCQATPGPRPPCTTKIFCSMRAARGSLFRASQHVQVQLNCEHDSYHTLYSNSHIMPQIIQIWIWLWVTGWLDKKFSLPRCHSKNDWKPSNILRPSSAPRASVPWCTCIWQLTRHYDICPCMTTYAHLDMLMILMNSPRFRQALSKPKLPATDAYIHFVCVWGILLNMTCQLEAQSISPDQLTGQNNLNLLIIHLNLHVTTATC